MTTSDLTGTAVYAAEERFLDALTAEQSAELRDRSGYRSYGRGAALFHERQLPDRVVVLLTGRVKLTCTTADGREVVLAVRGPGDLLGELSAIDRAPRSATAIALEPVEALSVAADDFVALIERHPQLALRLLRMQTRRLRDADRKRLEFAAQDSVGRMAARLVELCERFGEPTGGALRIDLPLSQEDLAGWTGCSLQAASRALQQLRELGWIETRRRSITVLDLDALRRRSV